MRILLNLVFNNCIHELNHISAVEISMPWGWWALHACTTPDHGGQNLAPQASPEQLTCDTCVGLLSTFGRRIWETRHRDERYLLYKWMGNCDADAMENQMESYRKSCLRYIYRTWKIENEGGTQWCLVILAVLCMRWIEGSCEQSLPVSYYCT